MRVALLTLALGLVCPLLLAASAPERAVFVLYPRVSLSDSSLTLADIGRFSRVATQHVVSPETVLIANTGARDQALTRAQVLRILRERMAAAKMPSIEIEFVGASQVFIQHVARITAERIENAANEVLASFFRGRFEEFRITKVQSLDDVLMLGGEFSISAELRDKRLQPKMCVWVRIDDVAGKVDSRFVPVWFEVEAWQRAAVLLEDVVGAAPFDEHQVRWDLVRIERYPGAATSLTSSEERLRFKHDMKAGQVLQTDDLEPRPAVEKGAQTLVSVRNQQIEIQTNAEALEDGQPGDMIKLQSLSSGEIYTAVVSGMNKVSVGY